jgi:hypothetical protein
MRGPMMIAPCKGIEPPIACTTPEPAKSTAPWPRPQFRPACARPAAAPDPVRVDAVGSATHKPNRQKFFQDHRSAIVPVGIVAVVSMNTIMKKNSAMMLTSSDAVEEEALEPMSRT